MIVGNDPTAVARMKCCNLKKKLSVDSSWGFVGPLKTIKFGITLIVITTAGTTLTLPRRLYGSECVANVAQMFRRLKIVPTRKHSSQQHFNRNDLALTY
jgi:hypothetical protein